MSESRVTWATSVPILVFLGLSDLDLGPMYSTDRRQTSSGAHHRLMLPTLGAEHNNDDFVFLFLVSVSNVRQKCCICANTVAYTQHPITHPTSSISSATLRCSSRITNCWDYSRNYVTIMRRCNHKILTSRDLLFFYISSSSWFRTFDFVDGRGSRNRWSRIRPCRQWVLVLTQR